MRVFLSYTTENSAVAAQLTRDWRERGVEVFRFGEPSHQAEIILDEIEREIREADVFVALMSPGYLTSVWCRRELRLAVQRENNSSGQFIHVVLAESTPHAEAESLGTYSWVDATGELTTPRLDEVAAALPFGRRPTGDDADFPGFRNRTDELNTLRGALQTTGGRDLWVVVSPPLMGKTWLLTKLEKELVNASPAWGVHRLDLRREPTELRYNPARLVSALLQVEEVTGLGEEALESAALELVARTGSMLFILDSADLLTPNCTRAVRAALTSVHRTVRKTGRRERLALVVATRRPDEWRGIGFDAGAGRFEMLALSQFNEDVVYQALLDLPNDIGVEQRLEYASRLWRLSEGLPALLVRSVQWAVRTGFLRMSTTDTADTFDTVARDYMRKDLLSADCLLPTGAAHPEAALEVLRGALRVLSTYRLYTQSHLAFHLDADPALREALERAEWQPDDLWEALGRTALQSAGGAYEIWQEIEPSIRRLLHRFHHRQPAESGAAHATARQFYGKWRQNEAAGREQQVVLVECLWHEACRLRIEEPRVIPELLPDIAVELARECGHGPMYQPTEYRRAVRIRLSDDDELERLLLEHDGLFGTIVESVTQVVGAEE